MFVLINKQHFKYYLCYMESNFTCNSGPMGKNTFSIGRMVTLVISMKRKLLYFPFFVRIILQTQYSKDSWGITMTPCKGEQVNWGEGQH